MPRKQTAAAERTEQNHLLIERAEMATGKHMTREEAHRWRRSQALPPPALEFTDDDLTRVGQILGNVLDIKVARGYAQMNLQCGPEYAHILSESVLLSGHPLLVTLDQVFVDLTHPESDGE